MDITVLYQDLRKGRFYDISDIVISANISTALKDQPSSLELEVHNKEGVTFPNGSIVSLKMGDYPVFYGFQFKAGGQEDGNVELTFYDQLRYLKYKDSLALGNNTIGNIFSMICRAKGLRHRVVHTSPYVLPAKLYDNKTYYEMLSDMILQVFIMTGTRLMIRDNFGVLELIDVASLRTNLFYGDGSLLSSFEYEVSIDGETYNMIKLQKEDNETKEVETHEVVDEDSIKYWGQLLYYEKVDENTHLVSHAKNLLSLKNREERTLSLEVVGDIRLRAGVGILVGIDDIKGDFSPLRYYLITECDHEITDTHVTKLELEVL